MVPIPGTKRRQYLEENIGAIRVTLTRADLERIDEIAPKGVAAGDRYPAASMKMLGR
jgi:aryl-alcohol dehydrogenase-like predicted oxidoreductase